MADVEISPSLDCSNGVDVGKPPAITLTMDTGVYKYAHAGGLIDAACVQITDITPFAATLVNPGWSTAVTGLPSNGGSYVLKRGVLTITAPASGTDTWTLTATESGTGTKVKVKFGSSPN